MTKHLLKNLIVLFLSGGDPQEFKHPNPRLYALMKSTFNMTDEDFKSPQKMGLEEVSYHLPISLTPEQVAEFKKIVGEENVREDEYARLQVAYGKTMIDLMRLREGIVENVPDLVIHPRDKEDIKKIVEYCNQEKINIYVYAGGSSVTRGVECTKEKSITLNMRVHMNRVLQFNEINQTITVEPGMTGPELEKTLNNAPSSLTLKGLIPAVIFLNPLNIPVWAAGWLLEEQAKTQPITAKLKI